MYDTSCDCVGPLNGEPYCCCTMKERGVYKSGDVWIDPSQGDKIIEIIKIKKEDTDE